MFKSLLKKYIFVLCSSISSTACLAMEIDKEDFSKSIYKQKIEESFDYGSKNAFNTILFYMEESANAPLFLARMFKYWPEKIKFFEDQLEKDLKSLTYNKAQGQYLIDVEKNYLESLCLLPKSDKNINSHLDLATLNNLGYRSLNFGARSKDKAQMIRFIDLAIWYSIMGAKTGCDYSYIRLKATIEFEIDNKKRYEEYYTFMLSLLMQRDEQAQMLFNKVCFDSEGALNWAKRCQIKVFMEAMENFEEAQEKKYYDTAMQLWKKSPSEAIVLLLKVENRCTEAKEKLNELRKHNDYLKPKKGKAHIHSRLLKESDTKHGVEYYRDYCVMSKNASYHPKDLAIMSTYLHQAVGLGNPDAIKEHKRIEKSKGYTDDIKDETLSSTNFEYAFARQYKAFLTLKKRIDSNRPLVQNKASQQNTPSQNITNSNIITSTKDAIPSPQIQKKETTPSLSKGTQKPNKTNSANNTNGVPLTSIDSTKKVQEEQKEIKENKRDLFVSPPIINDQIPTQSLEEGQEAPQVPLKAHRTLHRTQSLSHWPTGSKTSEERPLIIERKPIKRTLSLSQLSTLSQGSEEASTTVVTSTRKKNKNPITKISFKSLKLIKKKEKSLKSEGEEKKSTSSTKTSSSKSLSEEQISKSEGSLSTSKEKVPFSKFIRTLEGAQTKKDIKLSAGTITSTLEQLNNVTYKKNGNTISATHNLNSTIHLTLHTHDDSGTLWYKKPETVEHFLWFVGACNSDLEDRIYKIGKK